VLTLAAIQEENNHFYVLSCNHVFTLHAKLSGAVYCYRSCLFVTGGWAVCVCLCVCYHDNSKSIFTKLGL